jgi:hypothetical protein
MTTYDAELKNSVAGSKSSADPSVSGETARAAKWHLKTIIGCGEANLCSLA